MDNQDQGKNHSSGHESHGVHLCHKCGWPFPNPHPSAKHRRSHKKICGNIEGYKLVDSGNITHTPASDDESHSDEDHKTPITQVPESGSLGKNIGGIGAMSNRSVDEIFSDAAMEFQDSGFGLRKQESLDNDSNADNTAEKDLTATISFKDCEDTDILQPPGNSVDRIENKNPVLKSMPILSMGTPEHQDVSLSYSEDSKDRNGSASDVVPVKTETLIDVSEESREVSAGAKVAECSVGQATEANENEEGKSNKNLSGGLILPTEHAGEVSKTVSISEKSLDVTSDMVLIDDVVQLKEEYSGRLASKTSMSENGEQETDGKGNPEINLERNPTDIVASKSEDASITSEKTQDIISETGLADKIVELEEKSDKLSHSMVIDDLSSKSESAKDLAASTDTFEIQIDAAQDTDSATAVNSNEIYDKKEKENRSFYVLSVPDDIPVVDNAEIKLEGFKDHKRMKLSQSEALAPEEIIIDKEHEVRDLVSQDKSDTFLSNQLDEDIKVDASYMRVAGDSYKLGGNNEAIVKEVLVEGKTDVLQIEKGSDALSPVYADTTENEKDQKVCSLEEQQPVCVADDLRQTGFSGSMINLPDEKSMIVHADVEGRKMYNVVGNDDMGISESAGAAVFDIAGGDNIRRIDDENYVKNTVTSCESTNNSSLSHTNLASNLFEADNSDGIGTRITENFDISVVESGERPEEECVSTKTNSTFESINTHHQSPVVTEEVNEIEGPHLDRGSNSQDDSKESEISGDNKVQGGDNKVQGERAGEDLMASEVDNGGGNEFERTSVDQLKKELIHSPLYSGPTCPTSGAVDDSHVKASGVAASGTSTVILHGEADNGSGKPQIDTTVGDVSIESSSQTDSLEGHWGSISVLSTQSDNTAVVDTETLLSTGSQAFSEAEKANTKKSKVASEEQHCDKSDEFEPPSFMTLVEAGGGDKKDAVSEIHTAQNAENPKAAPLQAGWFPSLTHVANDSPGRKKNEEIIEKVTNWNAKQHTPLKNLLGEANSESKPKSPNPKENPAVVIPREEKVAKDTGALGTKVSSILGPETSVAEPTKMEARKEWNSPARYPADIKREKRKVKSRPLWVQFVCCSSAN